MRAACRPSPLINSFNFDIIYKTMFIKLDNFADYFKKITIIYSKAMGKLSDLHVPPPLLGPVLHAYSQVYGVKAEELPKPLDEFRSFREFFTRPMKDGLRIADARPEVVVSPVDGIVLETGQMDSPVPRTFRIKDRYYTIEELLGRMAYYDFSREEMRGLYALMYLHPGCYHRIHSPVEGKITCLSHTPGTLYPVNRLGRKWIPDYHIKNSKVVLKICSPDGGLQIFLVLIGALVVGTITLTCNGRMEFPASGREIFEPVDPAWPVGKGEELGIFNLGSSVIMICYCSRSAEMTMAAQAGEIQMGNALISAEVLRAG
jgi:phosphatidylserine decarboxylase